MEHDQPKSRLITPGRSNAPKPVNFGGRCVYVIDDDADVRRSLHFLLTTRHAEVTSFKSAGDFLEAVEGLTPSPIILDVRMPRMDGLQLIGQLNSREIDWPTIFLSGHGDISIAVRALKLGAADFLEKPVVSADLEACLEKTFATLDAKTATRDLESDATKRWARLTPRECSVLHHLCEGLSNKQVAYELNISPRTVEMHRANALRQLGVRSLPEVIKLRGAQS